MVKNVGWLVEVCKMLNYPLVIFIMFARSYITPADIQHRACVHLLGFRDSLAIILNLPAPHLRILQSMLCYYIKTLTERNASEKLDLG